MGRSILIFSQNAWGEFHYFHFHSRDRNRVDTLQLKKALTIFLPDIGVVCCRRTKNMHHCPEKGHKMVRNRVVTLSTDRLLLRPYTSGDQENLFSLYGNPHVMDIRKIGFQTRDESDLQLEIILDQWQRLGFGYWAIIDKQTQKYIGECGLREDNPDEWHPDASFIAISYGIIPEYWGQGFASEAAFAVVDFGFSEHNLEKIYGLSPKSNIASLRILENLGFEHQFDFNNGRLDVRQCVLSRATWKARGL